MVARKREIPVLDPERLRQIIADRADRLSRPRDLLLDLARSCRDRAERADPFPVTIDNDFRAKRANFNAAKSAMAKFYAKGLAEDIANLVPILDDIADPQRRSEAMEIVVGLAKHARGEAE